MAHKTPPPSIQLDRLMQRGRLQSVTYTKTNYNHGNGRPVIHYAVVGTGSFYANEAVDIVRKGE
jgi:hypothetical protein